MSYVEFWKGRCETCDREHTLLMGGTGRYDGADVRVRCPCKFVLVSMSLERVDRQ